MMIELHCVYISLSIAKYISSRLNIVAKLWKLLLIKKVLLGQRDRDFDVHFV